MNVTRYNVSVDVLKGLFLLKEEFFMQQNNLDTSNNKVNILIIGIGLTIGILFGTGVI